MDFRKERKTEDIKVNKKKQRNISKQITTDKVTENDISKIKEEDRKKKQKAEQTITLLK
jgi:hypothetical protein